ncbi:hypothetical protein PYW07_004401 [Mythimna separata]|uniref:Uncharacterized protein n=1 Tax=Mythimna separata TaxID=271217 RepID=A0AAD7YYC7_MYTSE|nr:hypothetical protein PYW07_004401 [Mythimna separata]
MEEINDVQALEKISSEVDESQIKVILSSQCIKAQAFLLDKLKKQAERHKETCGFISSANLKLEAEIKQAEHEINSMLIAQESIKLANVEMKKEWLVAKERKIDITERIEEGTKKYEDLWKTCKARYESIPFVQKLLQATEKVQVQNNDIDGLDKQILLIYESMKTRRDACIDLDRKRCIELANYLVNEMPKTMKIIKEKAENINDLSVQIKEMIEEQSSASDTAVIITAVEPQNPETIENNNDETAQVDEDLNKSDEDALIPKLELTNYDFDIMDVNLERAKMKSDEIPNSFLLTTDPIDDLVNKIDQCNEDAKAYEYIISPYFNSYKEQETHNFSRRKLINILEDVHINKDEVYNIVKKVNPENLRNINEISMDVTENVVDKPKSLKDTPIQSDTIEEVNMSGSNIDIIIPPTQFLDITLPGSQESLHKKRVSFDIPSSIQINEIIDEADKQNDIDENEAANQTINSQLDTSVASVDSYAKIQDMILKKHNLDLSPQFVYAKNPVLHKRDDDKIVTSKFFVSENEKVMTDEVSDNRMEMDEVLKLPELEETREQDNLEELNLKANLPMDVDEMIESSPKENKKQDEPRSEKPVPGLLFTHGTQAIPDSLNASMSTTGFDDSDFPHCIDSSLLLSPKADIPMTDDNTDVQSQEVPNFLSGFRKTGLSFFGGNTALPSEPKPDSSAPNDGNNFSFNFGGEKKNRGGLFSLFN